VTSEENNKNANAMDADTHKYLTGPRLVVVILIVITVAFLLFLDSSVIVTVSGHLHIQFALFSSFLTPLNRLFHK
jgi:hypothetical protein